MAKRKANGKSTRGATRARVARGKKSAKRPIKAKSKSVIGRKPARKAVKAKGRSLKKSAAKAPSRSKAKTAARSASPIKPVSKKAGGKKAPPSIASAVKRPNKRATQGLGADETLRTPPSSLDLNRRGSAARTGRAEIAETKAEHSTLTPSITGGDVDANVEDAYFTGDEAPGGDNPTPDQDVVDEIGKALGVEYQDNEELRGSDKVADRDKHRWELDPASAEDYRDRK